MNKFLKNILLFALIFFVCEKLFLVFIYAAPALEKDKRLEKIINGEINKKLVIIGSSRGARNIIAEQIEDSTGISSYNLSYPGSNIEFHEFLLRSLIKFDTIPKVILLTIDDNTEFLPDNTINFRYDRLYPLAKYNYINQEMIDRGEKNDLSRIMALSRINKKNFFLRKKKIAPTDTIWKSGSMPVSFSNKTVALNFKTTITPYPLNKESVKKTEAFLRFQDLCSKNGIKLILVYSPNFRSFNPGCAARLKQLSLPQTQQFIYDTTNAVYKDKDYYYDQSHLKINGAVIFTNEIIDYLRKGNY